jgi:cytochrome c oxidase subunit 1
MPVKMGMTLLLSLFFDDYGFPNLWAWVIYFILCGITVAFFWLCSLGGKKEEEVLFKYTSLSEIFLYLCLFGLVYSLNPYGYIPVSGTDIQKDNIRRCTLGKTITLENIEDVMTDCKKSDKDLKSKAGIESLRK